LIHRRQAVEPTFHAPYSIPVLQQVAEGDHLEDPALDGRIILKWIFERLDGGTMDWINVAQERDR
jgi:hypothetical protein